MEDQHSHIVHMAPASHPMSWHVFLLFIPAIAFALTVAIVASHTPPQHAASISEPDVLGEQIQQ